MHVYMKWKTGALDGLSEACQEFLEGLPSCDTDILPNVGEDMLLDRFDFEAEGDPPDGLPLEIATRVVRRQFGVDSRNPPRMDCFLELELMESAEG